MINEPVFYEPTNSNSPSELNLEWFKFICNTIKSTESTLSKIPKYRIFKRYKYNRELIVWLKRLSYFDFKILEILYMDKFCREWEDKNFPNKNKYKEAEDKFFESIKFQSTPFFRRY